MGYDQTNQIQNANCREKLFRETILRDKGRLRDENENQMPDLGRRGTKTLGSKKDKVVES